MAGIMGDVTNNLLGLQQLAQGRQELEQRNKSIENNRIASEKLRTFQQSQASGNPDYEAFNEAVLLSPELSKNVLAGIGVQEKRQGLDAADFAVKAASVIDNRPEFMNLVKQRIERIQARGGDPKDTIALAESYLQGDVEGARNSIKAVSAALANQSYLDKDVWADVFGVGGAAGNKVQSSNILDDGTVVQVLSNGETRVVDASGKALQGDARASAIRNAQNYGVGLQSSRAGGRTAASLDARVGAGGQAQYVEAVGSGRGKNLAEAEDREAVRTEGAKSSLPKLESQADDSIRLINELQRHPGRDLATGMTAWVPTIPGTEQSDFISRFDQVKGQAFLQAFENLKGGGAITEVEGKAATQAINRMNRATSKKEFDSAANDLKTVLNRGKANARKMAKTESPEPEIEVSIEELLGKY